MDFQLLFQADALAGFMSIVSGFVGLLIAVYSIGYIRPYPHKGEFFGYMFVFLAAMMGLIFSANLLLMYVFWEITALCSWRLIGFYRKEKVLWSADKAFLVTFAGASAMLAGFVLIYLKHGTLNMHALKGASIGLPAFILIMCGIFSKSAQLPLSSWLPDAGVAPTPVTALLHAAVLVKIGVYAYARLFTHLFTVPETAKPWLIGIVLASGLVAAAGALVEKDIKRVLAYSTISQLAYIFIGLIVGTPLAVSAALLYILAHSIGKAGLFLSVGIVEQKTHTKDLAQLGGLMPSIPLVGIAFLLNAASIVGLPPLVGFFSKFYVILGLSQAGFTAAAALMIMTAFITLLYLLRLFNGIFTGEVKTPLEGAVPVTMTSIVLICGVLSLFIGIYINYPLAIVNTLGASVTGN